MVSINDLRFSYGSDFTLSIDALEFSDAGFVSLIGPNGSGKTTLLRILAGLLRDYSGNVSYGGLEISALNRETAAAKVAYVPVYAKPDGPVTVRQFVLSGAYRYGGEADITEAAELCGIEKMTERSVYSVSSGEMKRVLIARALLQKTDVIVMDEPFANLDPHYEMRILELIKEISGRKLIISAVHNVTLASIISGRTVGLKEGRVAFSCDGSPDGDLLQDLYATEFISVNGHPFPDYFKKGI